MTSIEHDLKFAMAKADEDFITWLNVFLPDWKLEYSGDIIGLHAAYEAGRFEIFRQVMKMP